MGTRLFVTPVKPEFPPLLCDASNTLSKSGTAEKKTGARWGYLTPALAETEYYKRHSLTPLNNFKQYCRSGNA